MQITLTKTIKLYTSNMIAEVDFFKKSPYVELFKKHGTEDDVKSSLEAKIGKAAVKNLLQRLYNLGCIQQGGEIDVTIGFPEREYGKYQLDYYQNNTDKPFVYKVKGISRKEPVTQNIADELQQKNEALSKFLTKGKHESVSNKGEMKEKFSVLKVEGSVFHDQKSRDVELKLQYNKKKWVYALGNQKYPMDSIFSLEAIFERWNKDAEAQEWRFSDLQGEGDEYAIHEFIRKKAHDDVRVPEFGDFQLVAKDVPIIPSKDSVDDWFLFLFKESFAEQDCFMTADDTEQLWLNLYDSIPQFNENHLIGFDFNMIQQSLGHKDKSYWHMMAAKDLNPFQREKPKQSVSNKVVIHEQEACDVRTIFKELPLQSAKQLLILDRYINSKRHFRALEKIQETFSSLSVAVVSTKDYKPMSQSSEFPSNLGIKRLIKEKRDIPHDRHWMIDNQLYLCSKSLDFLMVDGEECSVKHVHFSRIDKGDMELLAEQCFKELTKELDNAHID